MRWKRFWRFPAIEQFLLVCLGVLLISFVVRSSLFEFYRVSTDSMAPNYKTGDILLVWRSAYTFQILSGTRWPARGSVILHRMPEDPNQVSIKRVLGWPGDKVGVDKQQMFWNGQTLVLEPNQEMNLEKLAKFPIMETGLFELRFESFAAGNPYAIYLQKVVQGVVPVRMGEQIVPAGKLFLLGDNRSQSYDSRQFGFLDQSLVLGDVVQSWPSVRALLKSLF